MKPTKLHNKRWMMMFAVASLLLVLTMVSPTAGAAGAAPSPPAAAEISIDNFTFSPPVLTVKVGTTVTWTNRDDIPHAVASNTDTFKSKALDTGDKFSFTPSKPGTYSYFCSIHPKMVGKIVVE